MRKRRGRKPGKRRSMRRRRKKRKPPKGIVKVLAVQKSRTLSLEFRSL